MAGEVVLGLDVGTGSARALLVTARGRIVAEASQPLSRTVRRQGWVDVDAERVLTGLRDAVRRLFQTSSTPPHRVAALGLACQRSTSLLFDRKSRRPLGPAISWQCLRTRPWMETLGTRKCRALNRRTGLAVVPHYAASKIAWLLQQRTRGRRHRGTDLHAGTLDSYLAAHLAEGCEPVTDLTQASRTLLVNLGDHTWSPQNLDWFGIPEEVLPRVVPTIGLWGRLRKGALRPLPAGLPLTALAGDQQAALYGTGMRRKGQGKITFGSGAFLLLTAGSTLPVENPRVLRSIAWSQRRQATYLIETNVPSAGTVIDWLADLLGKPYGELLQRDARRGSLPERLQDLLFLPTFAGLGALAPGLPPAGRLDGLRDDSDGPQLATALAAGIGAALSMGLEQARRTLQCPVRQLMADGGGSRDRNFLQIQSEFLGRPLQRCKHAESTAFGAAALAWAGLGVEAPSLAALGKPISPRVPAKTMELLRARFRSGLRALEQERA